MSPWTLEERIAALENQMADLRAILLSRVALGDWRRTVGLFTDDPGMHSCSRKP
jgi:hypothetical protein